MVQRLLFVSIFREGKGGGEGRVAYEMARWFSQYNPVLMLCPGDSTSLQTDSDGFIRFTLQSSSEGNLDVPLLSLPNVRRLFRYLDEFKPDIVHIHDPALLGVVAQLWAKTSQVPVLYTAHVLPSRALDFGSSEFAQFLNSPITEELVERYLLNFYQNCDAVVGLNEITAGEIREFGYTGPILRIPNGRNLSLFHTCTFADPAQVEKTLTFVGFLSKRKNQAYLIEAMQFLPANYRLVLIGEPLVEGYQEELAQKAEKLPARVCFTGQLSQPEVVAELAKSHVFVSASIMEVQSLAIIEALASGTPVVGLTNETVDELVDSQNGTRLPADASPQEFATAVQRICELDTNAYQALCKNARKRVDHLDWSNVMEKTLQSYTEIMAQKAKTVRPVINTETLRKYIEHIPGGRLQSVLLEALSALDLPVRKRTPVGARILWMTLLNMVGSIIGFYLLKGSIRYLREWKRKKR